MIGEAVAAALKDAAHAVDWVRDGNMALAAIATEPYDALLLDLGLPGRDGLQVLKKVRERDDPIPTVIVTARDALEDRIRGLDAGADDYVVKPFEMAELLARLRAVARRKGGSPGPLLSSGSLSLDPVTKTATRGDGASVALSAREYALLEALLLRPGAILSRSELEDRIYGWEAEVESNVVEFIIHSLRKKLGSGAIKNVRGMGWLVPKAR